MKESLSMLFHWKGVRNHMPFKMGLGPRETQSHLVMGGDGKLGGKNLLKFIDLNLFKVSEGLASWGFKLRNKRAEILVFILISLWDPPFPSTQDTFISCELGNTNTSVTELTPFLSIHRLKHLLGQQWGRGHCHLWGSTGTIWEWMK